MRRLEQLELMPSCGLAQHPDADTLGETCQMEPQGAATPPASGSESASKQTESSQKAPSYSALQQGGAVTNRSLFPDAPTIKQESSRSLDSLQKSDVAAMAALAVQLFTRQMHFRPASDTCYWHSQAPNLPAAAQQFVIACIADRPVSMQKLVKDSFFTAEVRAAADYLNSLDATVHSQHQAAETYRQPPRLEEQSQTVSRHGRALQAMLAGPLDLKALAKRGALQLCMRSIIRVVTDAATGICPSGAPVTAAKQQDAHPLQSTGAVVAEVLLRLVMLSPRSLAIEGPLQVWAALLGGRSPCGLPTGTGEGTLQAEVQVQLMEADRLKQLVAGVGLSAYVDTVHSALLSAVCGGISDTEEPAAAQMTQHAIKVGTALLKKIFLLADWRAGKPAHYSIERYRHRLLFSMISLDAARRLSLPACHSVNDMTHNATLLCIWLTRGPFALPCLAESALRALQYPVIGLACRPWQN